MPFKSTAQQGFMYANHPKIARRWSDEMKQAHRKGAKEHPIKAAHLPRHVGSGTSNVGKRLSGGSFDKGPSTVVVGQARTRTRRGTLQRFGSGSLAHGTRRPQALEHYSKGLGSDFRAGMNIGRDLRPNMPQVRGVMKPATRAGNLVGAATATNRRKLVLGVGLGTTAGVAGDKLSKAATFTPTSVLMRAKPPAPAQVPASAAPPVSSQAGGQLRPGVLVPNAPAGGGNGSPAQALGGAKSTPMKTNGTLKPTTAMGAVGSAAGAKVQKDWRDELPEGGSHEDTRAAARAERRQPPARIGGSRAIPVRVHSARPRHYDAEGNRQRRLGAAMAGTGIAGGIGVHSGVQHLRALNQRTKVVARQGASSGIKNVMAVDRRGAGRIAGGLAGLAAAGKLARYARDPRNREWS